MIRRLLLSATLGCASLGTPARAQADDATVDFDHRGPEARRFDYTHARYLVDVLYEGALFRQPDPQGGGSWANLIVRNGYRGLLDTAQGIGGSPEFNGVVWQYGAGAVVENLYRVWLRREPDPQGYWGWVNALERGQGAEALRNFVGSREFWDVNVAPW